MVWKIRKISAATTKLLKQGFQQKFYKRNNLNIFFKKKNSKAFLKEKEFKRKTKEKCKNGKHKIIQHLRQKVADTALDKRKTCKQTKTQIAKRQNDKRILKS